MKIILTLLVFLVSPFVRAQEDKVKGEVELTLMAIGDPDGGKLQSNSSGCAVVHFLNRTNEEINLPTAPRSLGLGRVENWNDSSYLSPKQGEGYGWGYRATYDIPKVQIDFLSVDGEVVHSDTSIQLQRIGIIEAGVWGFSPVLFSTPSEPGTYTLRFSFDNRIMKKQSGHSFPDPNPARLVTFSEQIVFPSIVVIKNKQNKAEMATPNQPSD